MSAFFRRADLTDAPGIARLVTARTDAVFGTVNVVAVIEKSILSITAVDAEGKIVAFVSFSDSPGQPELPSTSWEAQLKLASPWHEVAPYNTLFLSYLVLDQNISADLPAQLLRTLFSAVPDVTHCLLFSKSAVTSQDLLLGDLFSPTVVESPSNWPGTVLGCGQTVIPRLHVRNARAEDYDDLMPIFNKQSDMLIARFGEFYLADLIEAQNDLNLALVAEVDGKPVGFVAITSKVNISLLQRGFALGALNNLQVLHRHEVPIVRKSTTTTVTFSDEHASAHPTDHRASKTKLHSKTRMSVVHPTAEQTEHVEEAPQFEIVEEWHDSVIGISLFCMDEMYETQGLSLIAEAFARMPQRDYCVLTLPHASAEIPLLANFVRAVPVNRAVVPQQLYILHRAALSSHITVSPVTAEDTALIESLVSNNPKDLTMADIHQFLAAGCDPDGTRLYAYAVRMGNQVVGTIVLHSAREHAMHLRCHYNLEEFILFSHYLASEHAILRHFVINPIFERFGKFALREAMRKAMVSVVYSRHMPQNDPSNSASQSPSSFITDQFIAVKRRRQIVYPLEQLEINAPSAQLRELDIPFALSFLPSKLMLEPKITVNARIVVLGASDTGIAALEQLVYRSHLHFTNLTLVSRHGLPSGDDLGPLSSTLAYSEVECKQMALSAWVNVVPGHMTKIDRVAKQIVLADDTVVAYDHLLLTPGLQYNSPDGNELPKRAFTLNDKIDVSTFLGWAKENLNTEDPTVVVYGDTLDAYAMVNVLLQERIAGLHIILVQSKASTIAPIVLDDLKSRLLELGVIVMHGYTFEAYHTLDGDDSVGSVEFVTADGETDIVDCDAFVILSERSIDPSTFSAINDSFLVFDGRIVTDNKFYTNDSAILAGGPAAKFSRKYFVDNLPLEQYNSKEIGLALAQSILAIVDPLSSLTAAAPTSTTKTETMIPFPPPSVPKIAATLLPGNSTYVTVYKPTAIDAPEMKLEKLHTEERSPDGKLTSWFELAIDEFHIITRVSFFSLTPIADTSNLLNLYGLHEKLLNRLMSRFSEGLIKDFFTYFRDSWAVAVFHDRFHSFLASSFTQVKDSATIDTISLDAHVKELAQLALEDQSTDETTAQKKEELQKACAAIVQDSGAARLLKDRLMDYLTYNAYLLPNYARPGMW